MKTNSDYLLQALQNLKPGAQFSFANADYSTIVWDVIEGAAPTLAAVNAEIAKIKASEATV